FQKRVEGIELAERLAKMIVILCERTNYLGPRREDDQSQPMTPSPFGRIRQAVKSRHRLSQPAIAPRTGNVSRQHAQTQVEHHNQIATRSKGLIPISSPSGSGYPQCQASQPGPDKIASPGAT